MENEINSGAHALRPLTKISYQILINEIMMGIRRFDENCPLDGLIRIDISHIDINDIIWKTKNNYTRIIKNYRHKKKSLNY
ncbi:MAG: hypothetical protein ACD_4C00319G0001 [uncultured bacterium (gcode 4)]|uniref:Uncharacterized protein n=1 Tax=uncultured bacterium (gcode 4) TaxID=1234023 RepID=K2GSN8_9BACT|nr:MAG: hypothetical protein ACD_4C00319G0001 [uncultured bacterium (gcode 4)]